MPYRPYRPCFHPGCPNLCKSGTTYCEVHRKQHAKRIDKTRGTPAERGYDSKWVKIRLAYLKDHTRCVVCGQLADMVDHIVPIKDGGTHEVDNLQAMCTACHRVKTNTLDGGYGNIRQ